MDCRDQFSFDPPLCPRFSRLVLPRQLHLVLLNHCCFHRLPCQKQHHLGPQNRHYLGRPIFSFSCAFSFSLFFLPLLFLLPLTGLQFSFVDNSFPVLFLEALLFSVVLDYQHLPLVSKEGEKKRQKRIAIELYHKIIL